jgi:hypothetical protein
MSICFLNESKKMKFRIVHLITTMNLKSDFLSNGCLSLPPSSNIKEQYWTCLHLLKTFNSVKQDNKAHAVHIQGLFWKYLNSIYHTYGMASSQSMLSKENFLHDVIKAGRRFMSEISEGNFNTNVYDIYCKHTYPEIQTFFQTFQTTIQSIA